MKPDDGLLNISLRCGDSPCQHLDRYFQDRTRPVP